MENYEKYEEKILELIPNKEERACEGEEIIPSCYLKVIGCDYNIGISMVLFDDYNGLPKGTEILCIHGENSPYRKEYEKIKPRYSENYDFAFKKIIKCIKAGEIVSMSINRWLEEENPCGCARPLKCAFK